MERKSLIDSGIFLAALTAYLYAASSSYYGGYLRALHLDSDMLDRNFQQILYNGFLLLFAPAFYISFLYAAYRFIYSHLALPSINDWLRKSFRNKKRFLSAKKYWYGKRKDSELELREMRHSVKAGLITCGFLVLLLSLVYVERKGKKAGLEIREKIDSKSVNNSELIAVKINGKTKRLVYLRCGARNCAGADQDSREIYYFPQVGHSYFLPTDKSIESITSKKN